MAKDTQKTSPAIPLRKQIAMGRKPPVAKGTGLPKKDV